MESDVTPRTFWITLYKFFFPEIDYQNFGEHQEVRQLKIWQIDRGQLHYCVWENFFTFLSWLFGYEEKRSDKKVKINSKIYDVTVWTTNNYNTHIAQYLKN